MASLLLLFGLVHLVVPAPTRAPVLAASACFANGMASKIKRRFVGFNLVAGDVTSI